MNPLLSIQRRVGHHRLCQIGKLDVGDDGVLRQSAARDHIYESIRGPTYLSIPKTPSGNDTGRPATRELRDDLENGREEAGNSTRIRLFPHHAQTGYGKPARQADVYDHAAREYW